MGSGIRKVEAPEHKIGEDKVGDLEGIGDDTTGGEKVGR
jgi:hypothetical protein